MRKTKIITTLGPATEKEEVLEHLILAGVNIMRLNMSHAQHDWVRTVIARIRSISKRLYRPVGILMDTQGPAIRTGDVPSKLDLKVGDSFTFTVRGFKSTDPHAVDTNYDDLINDINVGDVVLVDNGTIRMIVREKKQHLLRCEVLTQGSMGSRRHINLPGVRVNLPALTEKDLSDIDVGIECGVDFIALSFVREANDIYMLRQVLNSQDASHIQIIAKIEDQSAVRNMHEIIDATDGVMVARGDLGIECPYEELPIIQRKIVKRCVSIGKPVIVATHMLESMITSPVPTRAEITDVANAVFESADAIMLSGETTVGKYPVECVKVLDTVARRIERSGNLQFHANLHITPDKHAVIASAVSLANQVQAAGLCLFTHSGDNAKLCASLRPQYSPIFAFTPTPHLSNQLTLRYGVYAFQMSLDNNDPEKTILQAQEQLLKYQLLPMGAMLVILCYIMSKGKRVLTVQLRTLE